MAQGGQDLFSRLADRGEDVVGRLTDVPGAQRLLEWRWGLEPLSVRDAQANNLATALDFSRRNLRAPRIAVPRVAVGAPCPA